MKFASEIVKVVVNSGNVVRGLLALLAICVGLAGGQPVRAQTDVNPTAQNNDYVLGTGDQIKVTVFGHDDLSGQFQIGGNGRVSLPLIGEINASGLTVGQVEQEVVGKLKPDYLKNPQVSVEVLNYRPFYILGEVNQPGSYPYVNGMRVINAVALAGGYTYRADEDDLWVTRAEGSRERAGPTTQVFPGDVIEVPERFF